MSGIDESISVAQAVLASVHASGRSANSRLSYPMQPECVIGKHFQHMDGGEWLHTLAGMAVDMGEAACGARGKRKMAEVTGA